MGFGEFMGGIGHFLQYNPVSQGANYLYNSTPIGQGINLAAGRGLQKNAFGDTWDAATGGNKPNPTPAPAATASAASAPTYQKAANPFGTKEAADALQASIQARNNQTNQQFAGLGNQVNIGLAGRGMLGGGQQQAVQGGLAAQKVNTMAETENQLTDRQTQLRTAFDQNEQARVDAGGQADMLYMLRKNELDTALNNQGNAQIQTVASLIPQVLMALYGSPNGGQTPPPLFKGGLTFGGSNNA